MTADSPTQRPGTFPVGVVAVECSTVGEYLERWLGHARGRVRTVTYEGTRF